MLHSLSRRVLQWPVGILLIVGAVSCGGQVAAPTATPTPAYPTRAITIVSGYDAGGTTSLVARMAGQYLGKKWNVPVNLVNKPGGNTVPAQVDVYGSAADGYTLYGDNIGSTTILAITNPDLPFKILDRTFINTISSNSMLIFVAPNSPIKTLKDAAAEAKRDPGSFTWAATGVAAIPMRQFLKLAGVDVAKTKEIVPSGSGNELVLGAQGSVKMALAAVGPSVAQVKGGLIHPLAIASSKRWASLPDVPTVAEAGFAGMEVTSWIGLSGPPNLPSYVVEKWNAGIQEMLKDPDIIKQLEGFASVPDFRDSKAMRAEVTRELEDVKVLWNK